MPDRPADATLTGHADDRLLLVFDGYCGVCTRFVGWLQARDRAGRVRVLPSQTPGLREQLGLSRADTDRQAWAVAAGGRRYGGAAAINRVLGELGPWRFVAALYDVPGLRQGEEAAYRLFARHRGRFARWGVTPACERPDSDCATE